MKKIAILVILMLVVVNCSYFEAAAETERRRGGVEDCRYRNWYSYINKWYKEWKYTENIIMNYINFFK